MWKLFQITAYKFTCSESRDYPSTVGRRATTPGRAKKVTVLNMGKISRFVQFFVCRLPWQPTMPVPAGSSWTLVRPVAGKGSAHWVLLED